MDQLLRSDLLPASLVDSEGHVRVVYLEVFGLTDRLVRVVVWGEDGFQLIVSRPELVARAAVPERLK